jgi:hypothetical protein
MAVANERQPVGSDTYGIVRLGRELCLAPQSSLAQPES